MSANEMREKYAMLYDYMANSNKTKYMKAFGNVMNDMMDWMIANKPELAMDEIEKLESIKWNNYLTTNEAEEIVSNMIPKAPWSREVWSQAMDSLGFPKEEEPYYNSCALWVEMNKIMSDHSETLASKVWNMPLNEIPKEKLLVAVHALAVDNLKDKDSNYSIREYFLS